LAVQGDEMKPDIGAIKDQRVRTFYSLYWPQHQAIIDFYCLLAEEQFDLRLVDMPDRKSDSPRESLAHILYVQKVYLHGVKTGKLEYTSMGTEHYSQLTKDELLAELERIDGELYATLTDDNYDSNRTVGVFWGGQMNAIDVLYFLRDHDILHIGWNLAYMDLVGMPRFVSLAQYWG
jgi:uncharacterized damage-inducible protein DinB